MGSQYHLEVGGEDFYLSAADDLVRRPGDGPTLGLILCKTKNKTVAQYALRDLAKPLGIAEYQLPDTLHAALPPLEALTRFLDETDSETTL